MIAQQIRILGDFDAVAVVVASPLLHGNSNILYKNMRTLLPGHGPVLSLCSSGLKVSCEDPRVVLL
jgi:hypothetical protein